MTTWLMLAMLAGEVPLECGLHPKARELAVAIIQDSQQQRLRLRCDGMLAVVAQRKAREMAQRGSVSHIGGGGANSRVVAAGYPLDKRYGIGIANQIEAVAGGIADVDEIWDAFKDSPGHRAHLLGEHPVYLQQDEIAVGYHHDWETPHVDYWVVYVARREDGNQQPVVLISKE
ncbi:CAP domain-containing protein [Ferrimonas marina]|uniref:Cysteine-rich secretory protein family protein n=1 Tax=Ferrimonas marina TaxID=299255 RepID=A0A1M5N1K6_9GAMM|nr:CAP domain-containing protein [Ferrimonas marina]SHG83421.1 hypothetical protein SAMN02745129_0863 [Ferrimonas marina]